MRTLIKNRPGSLETRRRRRRRRSDEEEEMNRETGGEWEDVGGMTGGEDKPG